MFIRARRPLLRAGALLLLQVTSATAQSASDEEQLSLLYGDRSMISIATGSPQPLRRAPAVASVITAQDIAAMGATDLDDVLESVPGLHVSRSHIGYTPLYLIRGIHSEFNPQTLMLQNGVPMTTLFIGNRGLGWGGLPLAHVARIEIIRGPGSALYGADAYSGVINIITKSPADTPGAEFGAGAGSFATRGAWLQYGGSLGPVSLAAYLRAGSTDGQKEFVAADAQTRLDRLFGTQASRPGPMNTGHDAVDGHLDLGLQKLRLRLGYKLRDDLGTGAGVAAALDPVGRVRSERMHADLSWNGIELAPSWTLTLSGSVLRYAQEILDLQLFPPGAFGGSFPNGMHGAPSTWERQTRLSAVAVYSGTGKHLFRIGLGHDDLDLYRTRELKNFTLGPGGLPVPTASGRIEAFPVAQSFMAPQRRRVNHLFLQDEWRLAPDWTLTAGLRHDRFSDFGGTTNPRAALVWDASLNLTAKLLYGRAFRAPAFTEQYSINNPVIRGNPQLRPETIRTWEAAFGWQATPQTQLNLSVFRYGMRDIIRTTDSGGGSATFNNIGSQRGRGVEIEAKWDAGRRLQLQGNYAWQRSTEAASGQDAGYAPSHHLYVRADWNLGRSLLLCAQLNHVGDRRRAAADARPRIADDTTFGLALRSSPQGPGRWTVSAAVANLFNAAVREPSLAPGLDLPGDIPLARRRWVLQAVLRY